MASTERDRARRQRCCAIAVVRREQHGGTRRRSRPHSSVEQIATFRVKTPMWFVEQPQRSTAGEEGGKGAPATLTGRQRVHRQLPQPPVKTERRECRADQGGISPGGAHRETNVLFDRQVVIKEPGVSQKADAAAHRSPVLRRIQVETTHDGRALQWRNQTGAHTQQRGLPGPIWPVHEHDLARGNNKIDPAQSGKTTEQGDDIAQVHNGVDHGVQGYRPVDRSLHARLDRLRLVAIP